MTKPQESIRLPSPAQLHSRSSRVTRTLFTWVTLSTLLFAGVLLAALWRIQVGANQLLDRAYQDMDTRAQYARAQLETLPATTVPPAESALAIPSVQGVRYIARTTWRESMSPCNCGWHLTGGSLESPWGPVNSLSIKTALPDNYQFSLYQSIFLPWESQRFLARSYVITGGSVLYIAYPLSEILQPFHERVAATWWMTVSLGGLSFLGSIGVGLFLLRSRRQDADLRNLAYSDDLTQIPNRRHFDYALTQTQPSALALLDLDNFKEINDTYGHAVGDALLKAVAARLSSKIRSQCDTLFRLGGDEFAIFFYGVSDPANQLENRLPVLLFQVFSRPFVFDDLVISVQSSCGWVALDPSSDRTQWLQFADLAMYAAKQEKTVRKESRARQYHPRMFQQIKDDHAMVEALTKLLAQQQHQGPGDLQGSNSGLRLEYQPKVDPHTQTVAGFEALLRIRLLDKNIPPNQIVELAEKNNLMDVLGFWVLTEALHQQAKWFLETGNWYPVAVNVSPTQLLNPQFISELEFLAHRAQVPPAHIQLEITENSLLAPGTPQQLVRLRALGFTLALDDFGTGYSSYATLADVDLDYLKLDRSFIHRLKDPKGYQLCKSLLATGKAYRLQVIAEGVEHDWQLAALKEMGVHFIQGWIYSKSLPPEQALQWAHAFAQEQHEQRSLSALSLREPGAPEPSLSAPAPLSDENLPTYSTSPHPSGLPGVEFF